MNHSAASALAATSGHAARTDDPEHAVAADSPAAIAQRGHQVRRQIEVAIRVRHDHEVVAGAVTLGEG